MGKVVAAATLALIAVSSCSWGQANPQSTQGFALSGVVRNATTSEPVANAVITVRPQGNRQSSPMGASTTADGKFVISNLLPGKYVAVVECRGFVTRTYGEDATVESNTLKIPGATDVTFRLTQSSVVAGRVTDAENSPLPGATIQLLTSRVVNGKLTTVMVAQTTTNDLGEYRIFGIPPGRYYIGAFYRDTASVLGLHRRADRKEGSTEGVFDDYAVTYYPGALAFQNAASLRLLPGKTLADVDVMLAMTRTVAVEGHVDNLPVGAEARVFLEPADAQGLGARQVFAIEKDHQEFRFKAVPAGEYMLRTQVMPGGPRLAGRQHIFVSGMPIRGIGLSLQPYPSLTGNIKMETGAIPNPVQVALVSMDQPLRAPARVQPDGRFSVAQLPPGSYRVEVSGESVLLKSLNVGEQKMNSNILEIDRSIDSLTLLLTSATANLGGTAGDAQGQTFSRGMVIAISSADQSTHTAPVLEGGNFHLDPLLPGDYRVAYFSDVESEQDLVPDILVKVAAAGETVTLAEKEIKLIHLKPLTLDDN